MGKHTPRKKDLSGQVTKYVYNGQIITSFSHFLYEVTIEKYFYDGGYHFLGSRYIKTDQPLVIKSRNDISYYAEYYVEKEIILRAAPESFIKEKKLEVYHPSSKKSKTNKKMKDNLCS